MKTAAIMCKKTFKYKLKTITKSFITQSQNILAVSVFRAKCRRFGDKCRFAIHIQTVGAYASTIISNTHCKWKGFLKHLIKLQNLFRERSIFGLHYTMDILLIVQKTFAYDILCFAPNYSVTITA